MIVGEKAVALILAEEIGSEALYKSRYQRPTWPGGGSGITIGIGYDLGEHTGREVGVDWYSHLAIGQVDALARVAGITGVYARARLPELRDVVIPYSSAIAVFTSSTLPRYAEMTFMALENCDLLPPDAFGALVDLTYNRGAEGYNQDDAAGRYEEMGEIADFMKEKQFASIPVALRAMKRLWPGVAGLRERREKEAALFEEAMKEGP